MKIALAITILGSLLIGFIFLLRNFYVQRKRSKRQSKQPPASRVRTWDNACVHGVRVGPNDPKKARIVKCENQNGIWYKDKIGEEVEIARFGTFGFFTVDGKFVSFYDVEFL